jgi:hypothetical protein
MKNVKFISFVQKITSLEVTIFSIYIGQVCILGTAPIIPYLIILSRRLANIVRSPTLQELLYNMRGI